LPVSCEPPVWVWEPELTGCTGLRGEHPVIKRAHKAAITTAANNFLFFTITLSNIFNQISITKIYYDEKLKFKINKTALLGLSENNQNRN
jgi:hypothetical protein